MSEEIKNEVSTTEEEKEYNEKDIAKELTEGTAEDLAAVNNKLDKTIESDDDVYENGTLNLNMSGMASGTPDTGIVDEHGKPIGDNDENVPATPNFSDGLPGEADTVDDHLNQSMPNFPNYMELFNTYKQLFENLTGDVEVINKKFDKLTDIIDKNNKETNAAIRATQIYSKLFTKLTMSIGILFIILIIILFIIK